MRKWPACASRLALILLPAVLASGAQGAEANAPAFAPIDAITKSLNLEPKRGLFTLFLDRKTGAVYMEVRADQLNKEFLYTARLESGLADIDGTTELERTDILEDRVFKIVHPSVQPGHLDFVEQEDDNYYDPSSPLVRSADANAPPEIFASLDIVAANADESAYLLRFDGSFDKDAAAKLQRTSSRARPVAVEAHPDNSDVVIDYPVSDFPVRVRHSLIALQPSNYVPRANDYRVGFRTVVITDLTSMSAVPYADVIQRWNLQKKDPAAALSEPVTPITFWIENTTPVEYRDAVKQGVLAWNKAFEAAGFKNALNVEMQPDNPDWSAGDIRHNVIRWVSSPLLPYRAETYPIANPRTGEIINATVILDYWQFRELMTDNKLFASAAVTADDRNASDASIALNNLIGPDNKTDVALGLAALQSRNADNVEVTRLYLEAVRLTVMHEIGHALGLAHNFMASTIRPLNELQNTDQDKYPLGASVMDYYPVNIAPKGQRQGHYYMTQVGPYDRWAIAYGYTPALHDPAAEAKRMQALLSRSTEPELAYGNDGDASEAGIDPRVMTFDLSSDPVGWALGRMELVDETLPGIQASFLKSGQSAQELRDVFTDLIDEKARAARILARFIGGIYVEHAPLNQAGAPPPFTPVPEATQKAALDALAKHVFAPDAFRLPKDLARYLEAQRRGRNSITTDPDILGWSSDIQKTVLDRVLSARVLARMTNARNLGGTYSVEAFLNDLTDAIFSSDMNGNINVFRQNLQAHFAAQLISILDNGAASGTQTKTATAANPYDPVALAAIFKQIQRIHDDENLRVMLHLVFGMNAETVAFRANLVHVTASALNAR